MIIIKQNSFLHGMDFIQHNMRTKLTWWSTYSRTSKLIHGSDHKSLGNPTN